MTKIVEMQSSATLEEMQKAVGGYIERVPYFTQYKGKRADCICNEEGKLQGLPINWAATEAWHSQAPMMGGDVLCGNVVIIYGGLK